MLLLVTACTQGATESGTSPTPSPSVSIPAANAEALSSVKVVDGGKGKAPTVTFTSPLKLSAQSMRLVTPGDGAQVAPGQIVEFHEIALDPATGKALDENFTKGTGGSITLNDSFKAQFPLVYTTFASAKVGAYIAYGNPAVAAAPASGQTPATQAQPASLSIFQVTGTKEPAKLMSAADVTALAKAGGLPTAKFDAKGVPSITIPKKDAPANLAVQVLTEGTGAVVKASDTISANYTGWRWEDGKKFDSSYDRGEAATFGLQQVIPGWTMGLTGQKVGSTVLLTIPTSLAYGENAAAQKMPAGTLVFVVKIEAIK